MNEFFRMLFIRFLATIVNIVCVWHQRMALYAAVFVSANNCTCWRKWALLFSAYIFTLTFIVYNHSTFYWLVPQCGNSSLLIFSRWFSNKIKKIGYWEEYEKKKTNFSTHRMYKFLKQKILVSSYIIYLKNYAEIFSSMLLK